MIVVVLLCVGLAWVGTVLERTRQQEKILEKLEKCSYNVGWRCGYAVRLDFRGSPVTDAGLKHLRGLTNLETLELSHTQITDDGLKHLTGLPNLNYLELAGTKITDAGLECLKGMTNLDSLNLGSTLVTDGGLAMLKRLTKLKQLELSCTRVTSQGIEELRKALPNCEVFWDDDATNPQDHP